MINSLLVETDWLNDHLTDPNLRIFDCTGALVHHEQAIFWSVSKRTQYEEGHIPGADYLDLHEELSDPNGRFLYTVPSVNQFTATMSNHGVGPRVQVVLYCAQRVSWATRVWWMLRLFGFDEVRVLNGGWEKWVREKRPISQSLTTYPKAQFKARPRPALLARTLDVVAEIGSNQTCILNALSKEQHTGQSDVHYGRLGHIPRSVNLPYLDLIDPESGTFLPLAELRSKLNAVGAMDASKVVTYCGGGIGATVIAFALALVGRYDVAIYDGSMLEWASDPSLPLEQGP